MNVDGYKQLGRNIRRIAKDIKEMRPFFDSAINIVTTRSDAIWAMEGGNVEKAPSWRPLSAKTVKARERRWGYYKRTPSRPGIMRWTGNLQENRERHVSDQMGRVTFKAPYAVYHQRGGTDLPRRVIVDLSEETDMELHKALQLHIHKAIGTFGQQV